MSVRPGAPRSPVAQARLARFDRHVQVPLVLAAVLPIIVWFVDQDSIVAVATYIGSWLVFVVDFAVRRRLTWRYVHTRRGVLDAVVVVVTAPWYLIPGFGGSRVVMAVRVARVARLLVATRAARRLADRLGRGAVAGVVMVLVCSYVAYQAERPTNPGFADYGDALWWGIVTITTVGYGDIVPVTTEGQWAGAALMVSGIGVLGALAGSLASFFGVPSPLSAPPPAPPTDADPGLAAEIAALRAELRALDTRLDRLARTLDGPGEATDG